MSFRLRRRYRIEAAHRLPAVPDTHPCSRLHGHTYAIEILIAGDIGAETGWVMDYAALDAVVGPVLTRLDHCCLNDIDGLENPTSEHLARWIWQSLAGDLPALASITVAENADCACIYDGPDGRPR